MYFTHLLPNIFFLLIERVETWGNNSNHKTGDADFTEGRNVWYMIENCIKVVL